MRYQGDSVPLCCMKRGGQAGERPLKLLAPHGKAAVTVQPRYEPPEAPQKTGFITLLFLKLLLQLPALFNCYKIPYSAIMFSLEKSTGNNLHRSFKRWQGEGGYDRKYVPCPQLDQNPVWIIP